MNTYIHLCRFGFRATFVEIKDNYNCMCACMFKTNGNEKQWTRDFYHILRSIVLNTESTECIYYFL